MILNARQDKCKTCGNEIQKHAGMQELQVFNNETFTVHTTLQRQTPYFRAADVARQLGYANGPQAVRKNVRDKHVTTLAALRRGIMQSTAPSGGMAHSAAPSALSQPSLAAVQW